MAINDDADERAWALKTALASSMFGGGVEAVMMTAPEANPPSYLSFIPPGSNILGFGFGIKRTGSGIGADEAVRVYVRAKLPRNQMTNAELIPDEIDGVPTDVIPVGDIQAAFPRPTPGGVSGSHEALSARPGTLGCLVERGGMRFILSNNHILANVNGLPGANADILEPARDAGGATHPPIARLTERKELLFGGPINEIDAAIAQLNDPADMTPDIMVIGRIDRRTLPAVKLMSVIKHGRTTRYTCGIIEETKADIEMGFAPHGKAYFHGQIAVRGCSGLFGAGGDSGSLVLEATSRRPVGLLCGVANGLTYCNHVDKVLSHFTIQIVE